MKLEILECLPREKLNAPPLLFVHGAYQGAWCWKEHFLPHFSSRGFASYALSLRGHGQSEGREKLHTFTLKDYAEDVLQVMCQMPGKPVLIGHSMGGAVVQKILYAHPDMAAAAVLMASNPPSGMIKDLLRMNLFHFFDGRRLSKFNQGKAGSFPFKLFFPQELPAAKKTEYGKLLQPESKKALKEFVERVVPASFNPQAPILVLCARKDKILSEKTALALAYTYKTKPVIFPDVHHEMMLDTNWQHVAAEIQTFLHDKLTCAV